MESENVKNEIMHDFESVFTEDTFKMAFIVGLYTEHISRRNVLLEKEN